jgi:hypothetical protein
MRLVQFNEKIGIPFGSDVRNPAPPGGVVEAFGGIAIFTKPQIYRT